MRHGKSLVASGLLFALAGFGCNSTTASNPAGAGPIDGTYRVSALTCNGTSTSFLSAGELSQTLILSNATGSFVSVFSDGCVATEGNVYTYPSSASFTMQKVNRVCSGAACSGSECTASSTAGTSQTWGYTASGTTLTLTRTSDGTDGCSNGQAVVYTATKQ